MRHCCKIRGYQRTMHISQERTANHGHHHLRHWLYTRHLLSLWSIGSLIHRLYRHLLHRSYLRHFLRYSHFSYLLHWFLLLHYIHFQHLSILSNLCYLGWYLNRFFPILLFHKKFTSGQYSSYIQYHYMYRR
ncbi:hypothetical protein JCM21531_3672 [Acetivibrio straminisolvens JCM 21531]|uniref:Uncharacterized protein n=1 Tax=Acetivibrio straminisolvens JCM 21531 TaxID=1294263 RepID=W4VBB0_9FIRM|nr:hypothetical protein JCM21531_3672 [Acetivibrio straminisolvens JCM 21531]